MSSYEWPPQGSGSGGSGITIYPNFAAFPVSAPNGTVAKDGGAHILYEYNTTTVMWEPIASNAAYEASMSGGGITIGALDSQPANANALALAAAVLSTQSADATHAGVVNTTGQTFAGNKNFNGSIFAANLSGTNSGDVTLAAVGSVPNANAASLSGQALTLQPADGTFYGLLSPSDFNKLHLPGDPNTFAGYDASGDLTTLPNWQWDPGTEKDNGLFLTQNTDPTPNPGSAHYYSVNLITTNVIPSATVPNQNPTLLSLTSTLGGSTNAADIGSFEGMAQNYSFNGDGVLGGVTGMALSYSAGDGASVGTTTNLNLFQIGFNNPANATLGGVNLINGFSDLSASSINTGNINLINLGINIAAPMTGGSGVSYANFGGTMSSTLSHMSGVGVDPTFDTGANVSSNPIMFSDGAHAVTGSTLSGFTSFNISPNFDTGSTLTGAYSGISVSPTLNGDLTGQGINLFTSGMQTSSAMNYINGFVSFGSLTSGASIANGATMFADQLNIQSGASVNQYTSHGIYPTFHSGSTLVTQYQGINANPTFDITVPSITLGQFNLAGSGSSPSVKGIEVNVGGFTSANQKSAGSFSGGALSAQSPIDTDVFTPDATFFNNSIGGQFHIAAGFPISGGQFGFGNNLGISVVAEDDMGPDATGIRLGYSINGFVNQIGVVAGKTLDSISYMLAGGGVPPQSTGGTIDQVMMFRALGFLPSGGTLAINNLYGFKVEPLFDAIGATNEWGVWVGATNADNWFAKNVVIAGTTGQPSNTSVALEIQGNTSTFKNAFLTTVERDALTPLIGMQIYNASTNQIEFYNGASWLSTGTISPLTTKGDLYGFDTDNARVPVGADFLPLVADSGAALGVSYSALTIAGGGTGQVTQSAAFDALSPMTTAGDLIKGGASGTGTRLAIGSNGDVLTVVAGAPAWAPSSGGTPVFFTAALTSSYSPTAGSPILYDTIIQDTASGWDSGTAQYIIPSTGTYLITTSINTAALISAMTLRLNGTDLMFLAVASSTTYSGAPIAYPFTAGDAVAIVPSSGVTFAGASGGTFQNTVSITKQG